MRSIRTIIVAAATALLAVAFTPLTGSLAASKSVSDCPRAVFAPTPCKAPIDASFDINMNGRGLSVGSTKLVTLTVTTQFASGIPRIGSYVQTVTWKVAKGYRIVAAYRRHFSSAGSSSGYDAARIANDTLRTGHVTVHEPTDVIYMVILEMAKT